LRLDALLGMAICRNLQVLNMCFASKHFGAELLWKGVVWGCAACSVEVWSRTSYRQPSVAVHTEHIVQVACLGFMRVYHFFPLAFPLPASKVLHPSICVPFPKDLCVLLPQASAMCLLFWARKTTYFFLHALTVFFMSRLAVALLD